MEFNYLENIKRLKEKITPFKRICNEGRCPKIRKRWEDHQHKYHSQNLIKKSSDSEEPSACDEVAETCDQFVQTSLDLRCNAETNCNIFHDNKQAIAKITSEVMNSENMGEFIARNQSCNTTVSFRNFYKERLQYEVLQWLREVPIESEFNSTAKIVTEKIVNNLIDKIDKLSVEADEEWYEVKLKREIDHCLNSLPMSYHSTKCAKIRYILTESLITRIMVLNSKYLYQPSNSFQDDLGVMNANSKEIFEIPIVSMFENEIFSWLESKNLKCEEGTSLNLKYITKMLLNRLLPFLMDKGTKRSKYLIKGGIVEVLDALPLTMALFKNRIFLNGLAMELANILMNAQNNFEQLTIYNNAYLGFIKTFTLNPNNNLNNQLKHDPIGEHLMLRMSKSTKVCTMANDTGDSNNRIFQSNTTINNYYRESHFFSMTLNISSFFQLDNTVRDLTLSHMTLKVLSDVKSKNSILRRENLKKTYIPNLLSISLDSVDERDFNSSCCSNFDKNRYKFRKTNGKCDTDCSKEETACVKKLSTLIRAWIKTLPKNHTDLMNGNVMESITGDFTEEITDRVMFDSLVPENNHEKEINLGDIILKWLTILGFVETSDEAILHKNNLLLKLRDVPLSPPRVSILEAAIDPNIYLNNYNVKDFMKENTDTLKENFLSWIKKQPLEICVPPNSYKKLVHDFAVIIYNELNNASYNSNITSILRRWLKNIIQSEENVSSQLLSKHYKNQIIQLCRVKNQNENNTKVNKKSPQCTLSCDHGIIFENIMRQCLMKFFNEPEISNRIAKDVFRNILSNVLQNVYSQYSKVDNEDTPFEKLKNELHYIILISDWYNKLPENSVLNRLSGRQRKIFLINLAKTIAEIENKKETTNVTDEDFYVQIVLNYCKQFGPLRNVNICKQITKPLVDALLEYQLKKLTENQNLPSHKYSKEEKQQEEISSKYLQKKCEVSDDAKLKEFSNQVLKQIKDIFDYFFSTFNIISTVYCSFLGLLSNFM